MSSLALAEKFVRLVVTIRLTHWLFLTIWPSTSTSVLSMSAISDDMKGFSESTYIQQGLSKACAKDGELRMTRVVFRFLYPRAKQAACFVMNQNISEAPLLRSGRQCHSHCKFLICFQQCQKAGASFTMSKAPKIL